jgi:hypothetical protein
MAAVGMSPKAKAMDEALRAEVTDRIAAESLDVITRYTNDGTLTFSLSTNIAIARA